jgi:hypothetical protein
MSCAAHFCSCTCHGGQLRIAEFDAPASGHAAFFFSRMIVDSCNQVVRAGLVAIKSP